MSKRIKFSQPIKYSYQSLTERTNVEVGPDTRIKELQRLKIMVLRLSENNDERTTILKVASQQYRKIGTRVAVKAWGSGPTRKAVLVCCLVCGLHSLKKHVYLPEIAKKFGLTYKNLEPFLFNVLAKVPLYLNVW